MRIQLKDIEKIDQTSNYYIEIYVSNVNDTQLKFAGRSLIKLDIFDRNNFTATMNAYYNENETCQIKVTFYFSGT